MPFPWKIMTSVRKATVGTAQRNPAIHLSRKIHNPGFQIDLARRVGGTSLDQFVKMTGDHGN